MLYAIGSEEEVFIKSDMLVEWDGIIAKRTINKVTLGAYNFDIFRSQEECEILLERLKKEAESYDFIKLSPDSDNISIKDLKIYELVPKEAT